MGVEKSIQMRRGEATRQANTPWTRTGRAWRVQNARASMSSRGLFDIAKETSVSRGAPEFRLIMSILPDSLFQRKGKLAGGVTTSRSVRMNEPNTLVV